VNDWLTIKSFNLLKILSLFQLLWWLYLCCIFYRPFFTFHWNSTQFHFSLIISWVVRSLCSDLKSRKIFICWFFVLEKQVLFSFVDYRPIFLETSCQPQNGVTRLYNLSRSYSNDFPGKRRIFTNSFNSLLHFSIVASVRRVGKHVTSLMS
jgi:hypothetical protein